MCISAGALVVMGHICFDSRFVNLNTFVYIKMNYWQLLIFCFWFQLARKKSGEKEHGGIGAGQIKDITSVDSYQITCIWLTDRSIGFQIVEFVWLFARFTWIFILTDSGNTKQLNNRLSIPACPNITKTKLLEINKHLSTCLTMRSFTKFFTSVEFWSLKPTTFSPPVLSDVRTILNHCIRCILFQTKHTLPVQTSTAGR